jgi:hypothetical protein
MQTEAGTWRLQCRGCSHVFDVDLTAGDEIVRTVKSHPCPKCHTIPCERDPKLAVQWHDIVDYLLPESLRHGHKPRPS